MWRWRAALAGLFRTLKLVEAGAERSTEGRIMLISTFHSRVSECLKQTPFSRCRTPSQSSTGSDMRSRSSGSDAPRRRHKTKKRRSESRSSSPDYRRRRHKRKSGRESSSSPRRSATPPKSQWRDRGKELSKEREEKRCLLPRKSTSRDF